MKKNPNIIKNTHTNKKGEITSLVSIAICFHYQIYMHTLTYCFTNLFQCNLSCCQTVLRTEIIHMTGATLEKNFIDGDFGQIYDQTFIHVYRSE